MTTSAARCELHIGRLDAGGAHQCGNPAPWRQVYESRLFVCAQHVRRVGRIERAK